MKRSIIMMVVLLIIVLGSEAMADSVLSVDRFVELVGNEGITLSESELEEIIRRNHISEEKMDSLVGLNKAMYIDKVLTTPYQNCYTFLFEEDETSQAWIANDIVCIAIVYPAGAANESILANLVDGKYYYDPVSEHFSNITESEKNGEISEAQKQEIIRLIQNITWDEIKKTYKGDYEDIMNSDEADWSMAIETKNGVVRYTVEAGSKDTPEALIALGKNIIKLLVAQE